MPSGLHCRQRRGQSNRVPPARPAPETDGTPDGARARAAQTAEGMPVRDVGHPAGALPVAPAPQALPHVARVEAEDVADVAEAARPAHVLRAHPLVRLAEQAAPAPARVAGVALEGDHRLL